ncbi:MAG TPA: alanine--tRNA ligase [Actinomycetaceae bacterium]|nr:alanine--tRNA ligase [Actinomycetaceae bacterium]
MKTSEIRERWLKFFGERDHHVAPSVSLVSPDPSILFTIAGMVPFIPYIIGTEKAPWPRVASVQKCIRTNDIDEVGKTTRHGTFFQMAGNFSFGDYFKERAIQLAWDLLTLPMDEGGYGLDGERLWMTIWEQDHVSHDYWVNTIGVDPERVQMLPYEEIEWSTGQPGPAGSCCEIHYDRGPEYGPAGGPVADKQGDRYLEIWNLVFDEFMRGPGSGANYELLGELEQKTVDTGLGVERIAYLLQGKENVYEIDEVFPVIARAAELAGITYGAGGDDDVRLRVVGDHVRSALMLIGDGVRPGNDGRGYVLRRIIRRAIRSMRLLGVDQPVLPELLPLSMEAMSASYPEVKEGFERIGTVAYAEEDSFRRTLTAGTTMLDSAIVRARGAGESVSGAEAFRLHDTYGFPIDLTLEIAAEQGVEVDAEGFRELMSEQKERARADALAKKKGHVDSAAFTEFRSKMGGDSQFVGYTDAASEGKVIGILVDGKPVPAATAPADVEIVLDRTPFYAESGGQLGDQGTMRFTGGAIVDVIDTQAPVKGVPVHRGTVTEGTLVLDEMGVAEIDVSRRRQIAQAHTATHMVHQVLLETLGRGASQAGSENSPSRMRFDFRHGSGLSRGQMQDIEGETNQRLAQNLAVTDYQMKLEEARAAGVQALFGEKYGKIVRVVDIGEGWSRELCGGTHVPMTGNIGRVDVLGESSIGSGVRRIEALVGSGAYAHQAKESAIVSQVSQMLGARPDELPGRISSLMERLKQVEKELAAQRSATLLGRAGDLANTAESLGSLRTVVENVGEAASADDLRSLALDIRGRLGESGVVALIGVMNGRPIVAVAASPGARTEGVSAGRLVRSAARALGGGGGGKDDVAQGGGIDIEAIPAALEALTAELREASRG